MKSVQRAQIVVTICIVAQVLLAAKASAGFRDNFIGLLNIYYGEVCSAKIEGVFNKTLKIDWTENTTKLMAIKVIAEIGTAKEELYADGVRYFKFPNDSGGYNIIDWKTGKKRSVNDRAPYYFSE